MAAGRRVSPPSCWPPRHPSPACARYSPGLRPAPPAARRCRLGRPLPPSSLIPHDSPISGHLTSLPAIPLFICVCQSVSVSDPLCVSLSLSVCLSQSVSVSLSVFLPLIVSLVSASLSLCASRSQSVCLSVSVFVSLHVSVFASLCVSVALSQSVSLSLCPCVCLSPTHFLHRKLPPPGGVFLPLCRRPRAHDQLLLLLHLWMSPPRGLFPNLSRKRERLSRRGVGGTRPCPRHPHRDPAPRSVSRFA